MSLTNQFLTLTVVAFVITFLVYGSVALIVKADDYGIYLVRTSIAPRLGKLIVVSMPYFLSFLTLIGTVAMLWVGGSIISHSVEHIGYHAHAEFLQFVFSTVRLTGFFLWVAETLLYICIGFIIGAFMYGVGTMLRR